MYDHLSSSQKGWWKWRSDVRVCGV